ncbi:MAG: SDR family NAD(P)-dependent oxidoreductase [Bacteroidia bacterium]
MEDHPTTTLRFPGLSGKRIVIIGGTSGIGLAAGRAFAGSGAHVVALGLDNEWLETAKKMYGPQGKVLTGDAAQPESVNLAINLCVESYGGMDGLFHVAGGSGRKWGDGLVHELTDEGWEKTIALNLSSVMYSNRAAIRHWLSTGTEGSILNTASVLATSPSPAFFSTHAYAAAKSAVTGLTLSIAAAYASQNIRANVLAPGLIETPMARRAGENPQILAFIHTKQPLDGGRIGRPEDTIGIACYAMSDLSRFTTGQVFTVDGGWQLSEGQIPPQHE